MKKSELIEQTLASANLLLTAIQEGGVIDSQSFQLFSEALIRYVFFHFDERTHAQYMQNVARRLVPLDLHKQKDEAIVILQEYITELEIQADLIVDAKIEYEPIFDRSML